MAELAQFLNGPRSSLTVLQREMGNVPVCKELVVVGRHCFQRPDRTERSSGISSEFVPWMGLSSGMGML